MVELCHVAPSTRSRNPACTKPSARLKPRFFTQLVLSVAADAELTRLPHFADPSLSSGMRYQR